MRKTTKRLALNRETLRALQGDLRIAGGTLPPTHPAACYPNSEATCDSECECLTLIASQCIEVC